MRVLARRLVARAQAKEVRVAVEVSQPRRSPQVASRAKQLQAVLSVWLRAVCREAEEMCGRRAVAGS